MNATELQVKALKDGGMSNEEIAKQMRLHLGYVVSVVGKEEEESGKEELGDKELALQVLRDLAKGKGRKVNDFVRLKAAESLLDEVSGRKDRVAGGAAAAGEAALQNSQALNALLAGFKQRRAETFRVLDSKAVEIGV